MGCFSPDAPGAVNYGGQAAQTLAAQIKLAPQLYNAEAQYQPQYTQLALNDINTIMNGANGTPGLFAMQQQQTQAQREADINAVTTLGPQAQAALLAANPYQKSLMDKLNAQANAGLDAGASMTPEQQRAMQQQSRAAFSARGMAGSNVGISDELLKQFNLGNQLQQQRQQFAQSMLGSNQSVMGDPYQQVLGRPSSNLIGNAQQIAQGAGPGLFNPDDPLSAAITAGNQQMYAQFAGPSTMSRVSTGMGMLGSLAGGAGSAGL